MNLTAKELFWTAFLFILINVACYLGQDQIRVNDGRGWDGLAFCEIARMFAAHEHLTGEVPQVYRVGTPFLAVLVDPVDLPYAFRVVNVTANIFIVFFFTVWLGLWIRDWRLRLFLSFLFQANWAGPVRFVWFYSVLTDHWPLAFILLALILMTAYRDLLWTTLSVGLIGAVAILFREISVIIPAAFVCTEVRLWGGFKVDVKRAAVKVLAVAACLLAFWLLKQSIVITGNRYTFTEAMRMQFGTMVPDAWALSWFITYGPLFALVLLRPKQSLRFLAEQPHLGFILLAVIGLSMVGGRDYERFYFWASPVIYLLIGLALESGLGLARKWWVAAPVLGLQAVAQRLFWSTPEPLRPQDPEPHCNDLITFFTSDGPCAGYKQLLGHYTWPEIRGTLWMDYLVLMGVLVWLQYWSSRQVKSSAK